VADASPLQRAYLSERPPGWDALPLAELKNRRARRRGAAALALAACALALPAAWLGPAWTVAVRRVLNPFSQLAPPSLAALIDVQPGNATVEQGASLSIECRARGRSGQSVDLDLWPADDARTALRLGSLSGRADETFRHVVPKVTGDFRYRFRAGDALPSPVFRVEAVPPLALASLRLTVEPPAYTRRTAAVYDGLTSPATVPSGARVLLEARLNRAATLAAAAVEPADPLPLEGAEQGRRWTGALNVFSGQVLRLVARDARGATLSLPLRFDLIPDRPPTLRVVQPSGRALLAPGASPVIRFEAGDDIGVDTVTLERVPRDARPDQAGEAVAAWSATNAPLFAAEWRGGLADLQPGTALRLAVCDGRAPPPANRTVGVPIVFELAGSGAAAAAEQERAGQTGRSLGQIVEWQRANLRASRDRAAELPAFDPAPWRGIRERQSEIRLAAADLLREPAALGSVLPLLDRAWREPMSDALAALDRLLATAAADERPGLATRTVSIEETILRLLQRAETGLSQARPGVAAGGLLALIEALVKGQAEVLQATAAAAAAAAPAAAAVVARQDGLAVDLGEFLGLCGREAAALGAADAALAGTLTGLVNCAQSRGIKREMLAAAESLEGRRAAEAVGPETRALEGLKELRDRLNAWRADDASRLTETAREEVQEARDALAKLEQLQARVVEALRPTGNQGDKSGRPDEQLLEDLGELKPAMADAALKIATDLQALPELPVGNELVEDVYQVYEAMAQPKGSGDAPVTELGLQKEDWILDALKTANGRLDDMEMWLTPRPDVTKRNIENFDREELPPIGMVSMPDELQDIIGDLLEQQDDLRDQADDSTGNQGTADLPAGWDIAEGEFTSYGAKGKSGNERPEHKDQDGRSAVGRQGMSDGEVVAGSGKINDGDEKIDKRMTQDPSQAGAIQEEDHRQAKATGGGKLSGYGEERGMAGMGPRRDANTAQPSDLGQQAMLRRNAETLYARATMSHLRTGRLDEAIRHMRQAEEALAGGLPIRQVREFQRRAAAALRATQADLDAGPAGAALGTSAGATAPDETVASTPDEAPAEYRELVSDYFRSLRGAP
jgi:tetratricopeptide (TPR) repeat protein